jgi:hypothetical protein
MATLKGFGPLVLVATVFPALFAEPHCPGNVVSLPFRLVNGYQIVVPVSINHSGPYDFLLDTGTQMTIVGPSLAGELHLNAKGAAKVSGAAFQGSAFLTQLEQVKVGPHSLGNRNALVYELLNLRSVDGHVRGILGEDFLGNLDMFIDYSHKLLCLDDSTAMRAAIRGTHVLLLTSMQDGDDTSTSNLLIVAAHLSGESGSSRLMLDSGSSIPYLYNSSQRLPQVGAQRSFGGASLIGSGADGDQQVFFALPPQKVRIGKVELPQVTFLTLAYARKDPAATKFDGLLTMNLFRYVFICHAEHFAVLEAK